MKKDNVYKIIMKLSNTVVHIAYYSAINEFFAMHKAMNKHDIPLNNIISVSLSENNK
jgi:hypothetical protein